MSPLPVFHVAWMDMSVEPSTGALVAAHCLHCWSSLTLLSPYWSTHQLPVAPLIMVRLQNHVSHLNWGFGWLNLVQVLCRQPQTLWVHELNGPVMCNKYCFLVYVYSWLIQSLLPHSRLGERKYNIDLPLKAQDSTVSYYLNTGQLLDCVNHHLLQKRSFCDESWRMQ